MNLCDYKVCISIFLLKIMQFYGMITIKVDFRQLEATWTRGKGLSKSLRFFRPLLRYQVAHPINACECHLVEVEIKIIN